MCANTTTKSHLNKNPLGVFSKFPLELRHMIYDNLVPGTPNAPYEHDLLFPVELPLEILSGLNTTIGDEIKQWHSRIVNSQLYHCPEVRLGIHNSDHIKYVLDLRGGLVNQVGRSKEIMVMGEAIPCNAHVVNRYLHYLESHRDFNGRRQRHKDGKFYDAVELEVDGMEGVAGVEDTELEEGEIVEFVPILQVYPSVPKFSKPRRITVKDRAREHAFVRLMADALHVHAVEIMIGKEGDSAERKAMLKETVKFWERKCRIWLDDYLVGEGEEKTVNWTACIQKEIWRSGERAYRQYGIYEDEEEEEEGEDIEGHREWGEEWEEEWEDIEGDEEIEAGGNGVGSDGDDQEEEDL